MSYLSTLPLVAMGLILAIGFLSKETVPKQTLKNYILITLSGLLILSPVIMFFIVLEPGWWL